MSKRAFIVAFVSCVVILFVGFQPLMFLWVVLWLGGLYVSAICLSVFLLWPLSSYRSRMNWISFFRALGEEQMRWQRQSSPLNEAMAVLGSWHDCGFIPMFVLDGLRYTVVLRVPFSCLVMWTSRNAMEFSSSSSGVNWTLGCTELRQTLNSEAGLRGGVAW